MELPSFLHTILLAGTIGVVSHLAYFIRGEHHKQSFRYLVIFTTSPILVLLALLRITEHASFIDVALTTSVATISYFAALFTSIVIYRVFFHPLRNFPGPFRYRISKLAHVADIARTMDNYYKAEDLRQEYGDIVRVGPNELSIFTPEGAIAISGVGSKCTKAPWYDSASNPFPTMHTTRDRVAHDKRRKIWDRGFGAKALRDYEVRVVKYADELMSQFKAFSGKPLNASRWLNYYSFDVMGDLAFGHSFDMLRTGKSHHAIDLLVKGMEPIGIFTPIPWIFNIFYNAPGLGGGVAAFKAFAETQVAARKEKEPENPDLMSWLIDAEKNGTDPISSDKRWLAPDSQLIIIAGSDTTAASLTFIMYHLAKAPHTVTRLREELREMNYFPGSQKEFIDMQDAKYLNGVINEVLRLHPAIPSGVLRLTPPEGITTNGRFIPGGVTISSPFHSMGRLESCYEYSNEFMPERWVDKPELVRNKSAFAPFGSGVYGCVGKNLALMEMRSVVARTVTEFDIKLAPGEDGTNLLTKTKDSFTMHLAPLNLVFTARK